MVAVGSCDQHREVPGRQESAGRGGGAEGSEHHGRGGPARLHSARPEARVPAQTRAGTLLQGQSFYPLTNNYMYRESFVIIQKIGFEFFIEIAFCYPELKKVVYKSLALSPKPLNLF